MYVRDAKNREEVWLLDRLDDFGFEDTAFRSRDYLLAIDETTGEKAGFGRLRVHRTPEGEVCEVTNLGVLEPYREQGVGAQLLQRLIERARDDGFETVYGMSPAPAYLEQFGFEPVEPAALPEPLQKRFQQIEGQSSSASPVVVSIEEFGVPRRLRRRFTDEDDSEEQAEDFGIDPDSATYKYDVDQ